VRKAGALPDKENIPCYKRFVSSLVERYDGDGAFGDWEPSHNVKEVIRRNPVHYWQIENEPGSCDLKKGTTFWNGTSEELAELVLITSDCMKSADPESKLILSGFGVKPLTKCCENGYPNEILRILKRQGGKFEIFDIHNYRDVDTIYEQVACVRRLLQKHGFVGVKIWMTETGFNWRKLELGVAQRAYNEVRAITMIKKQVVALSLGVEKIFQWTFSDKEKAIWPPKKKSEFTKFRGITDKDLNPKSIYSTYQLMASKLDSFDKVEEIGGDSNRLFRFFVKNRPVFVAWSNRGAETLSLDIGEVRITDPFGAVTVTNGHRLRVSDVPLFIEPMHERAPTQK